MLRWFNIALLFVVGLMSAGFSQANVEKPWDSMALVGQAKLKVALFNIYEAKLYAQDLPFSFAEPYALKLTYLRNFSKKSLIKETKKQLKKIKMDDHENFETWFSTLEEIWVDVKKRDAITLHKDNKGHAQFYFNDRYLGEVADQEFTERFASIWLSEQTTRPSLRKKLLGVN